MIKGEQIIDAYLSDQHIIIFMDNIVEGSETKEHLKNLHRNH